MQLLPQCFSNLETQYESIHMKTALLSHALFFHISFPTLPPADPWSK